MRYIVSLALIGSFAAAACTAPDSPGAPALVPDAGFADTQSSPDDGSPDANTTDTAGPDGSEGDAVPDAAPDLAASDPGSDSDAASTDAAPEVAEDTVSGSDTTSTDVDSSDTADCPPTPPGTCDSLEAASECVDDGTGCCTVQTTTCAAEIWCVEEACAAPAASGVSVQWIKPAADVTAAPGETVPLLVDAGATLGLQTVRFYVDGIEVASDAAAPFELDFDVAEDAPLGTAMVIRAVAVASDGAFAVSDPRTLTVSNTPPVAEFAWQVTGPATVTLDASGSTDAESLTADLEFRWDFGDDGSFDVPWSANPVVDLASGSAADVRLEVRDPHGAIASQVQWVDPNSFVTVSGTVTDDVWSGVIVVTGSITTPTGHTLTIEAGTQVLFAEPGLEFTPQGHLLVLGTESHPVRFAGYGLEGTERWGGLRHTNGYDFTLIHFIIEGAETGVTILDSGAELTSGVIRDCETGLRQAKGNTPVSDVTFADNDIDGALFKGLGSYGNTGTLTHCTFTGNGAAGLRIDDVVKDANVTVEATGCRFEQNGVGVHVHGGPKGWVQDSWIRFNDGPGVVFSTDFGQFNYYTPLVFSISGSNIYGNSFGGGLGVVDCGQVESPAGTSGAVEGAPCTTPNETEASWVVVRRSSMVSTVSVYKNDVFGSLLALMSSTSPYGDRFQDVSGKGVGQTVAVVEKVNAADDMWVRTWLVHPLAAAKTEVLNLTTVGVNMPDNYWGTFPDVEDRAVAPSYGVNMSGYVSAEIPLP